MPDRPRAPFLAAAHREPAHRTPVWFMRQAGRHLPEYRAVRGEGSILHAIKRPEVAAEITLQPVRRYGVDAAVLYSDIVVPAHAVGRVAAQMWSDSPGADVGQSPGQM